MKSGLLFTTSPWLTILCVAAGLLYAWALYSPNQSWSRQTNLLLAAARSLLVATICFLLLAPRIRKTETNIDKAKLVIAVDNSLSMKQTGNSPVMAELVKLESDLTNAGYEVSVRSLSGNDRMDTLKYELGTTDLSTFLNTIRSDFEGQHLTEVLLLTDGIFNLGASPVFGAYPFKIHTIAVGDTVPVQDLRINNVRANQVAFLGNQFPIQADLSAFGMAGSQATITLRQGNKTLVSKPVRITNENFFQTIDFQVTASEKGLQRFSLEVTAPGGDKTIENNQREVYIDIIDGRENILLLALSPHPDLKALRSIISKNDNFELDLHILSMGSIPEAIVKRQYDLVLLHQLPDLYNSGNNPFVTSLMNSETPVWYFYGNQSAPASFNRVNRNVNIKGQGVQQDQVTGRFNSSFNTVILDAEKLKILEKLPPVSVPFGDYSTEPGTETVLYQRVGNVATQKPLLTVRTNETNKKTAAFLGDGIWAWRQEEYAQTGKTDVLDEMVQKLIQLLAVKEDKRKFRVIPTAREYPSREPVVLRTELYNDVFERVYGNEITLKVTNEQNQTETYEYLHLEEQPDFTLSGLKEGAYRFVATTTVNGKQEQAEGRFLIRDLNLELLHTTANHGMLRELSAQTGGQFVKPEDLNELNTLLQSVKTPDRLSSRDEVVGIIHLRWLFFLLVALAAVEWGMRKYLGAY